MHKLLVFDLDGTLAALGKGITPENVARLQQLERVGYRIAICSGKPTYYLCGFLRQVELDAPILIGENGATFQYGVDLPPKRYEKYPCSERAKAQMAALRQRIDALCADRVWYQPNELGLTPFPVDDATFEQIQALLDADPTAHDELAVYRHCDSFDLTPKNVNKYNGLSLLAEQLGIEGKDVIAVGDGPNDLPMLEFADLSIAIGERLREHATLHFDTPDAALQYLLQNRP